MQRLFRRPGKSLAHLQIQLHLKSLLADLVLEKKLSNRIADAYWEKEKIVFEIQYSSLTLEEAQLRTADYLKLGVAPVWILHDKRYNRRRLSPAEIYLRSQITTYFTDGRIIYDQFDVCQNGHRLYRGPQLPIDPTQPSQACSSLFARSWPLSFQGDLLHWAEGRDISHLKKIEKRVKRPQNRWKSAYKFLIYRLLESCS